jgi:hypothetical protein
MLYCCEGALIDFAPDILNNYIHIAGSQKHGGDPEIWGCKLCISCQDNNFVWIICYFCSLALYLSAGKMTRLTTFISSRLADLKDFKKVNEIYAKCEFCDTEFHVSLQLLTFLLKACNRLLSVVMILHRGSIISKSN